MARQRGRASGVETRPSSVGTVAPGPLGADPLASLGLAPPSLPTPAEAVGSAGGIRVLWFGDMAATGFGTVTMDVGRQLLATGLDVRFVSQNDLPGHLPEPFLSRTLSVPSLQSIGEGLDGGSLSMGGVTGMADAVPRALAGLGDGLFLSSGEPWGDWRPDACFLLGDFAAVRFFTRPHLQAFASLPTFHYCPIEGVDLPPAWSALWRVARPVAMSNFGADQIAKVTGYRPPVVYHGVDGEAFHPVSESSPVILTEKRDAVRLGTANAGRIHRLATKDQCKRFFMEDVKPGERWVLRTDRHMPRKVYNSLLRSMAPVLASRENVRLVIHCREYDQGGNLFDTLSKYPREIQQRVVLTGLGPVPREVLVALYNAADVYVSPSAEGFGLTIAEAVACGVPAVVLDYAASPEVVGPAGATVPVGALFDNEYDHLWARPDEEQFGAAVGWMVDHPARARMIGSLGPKHVRDTFSWAKAAEAFAGIVREAVSSRGGRVP